METLTVGLGDRSYRILGDSGNLPGIGALCRELGLGRIAAIVTNTTVGPLYSGGVAKSLVATGFSPVLVELPDGEEFKTSETLNTIYNGLIAGGLTRDSFVIALGGGVVGDMAGFAAATYLRGIPFVQVPTTLLAQVDSSVGGKTGINHPLGKNLIGAFYQPRAVVIDVDTLATLAEREYLAGMAEVVKYGVVLDRELFAEVERNVPALLTRDKAVLTRIIIRCCSIKASVVEKDEREAGLRAVLNYGHTLGHAVETLAGYGTYLHGEAVAIGMVQAARLSEHRGLAGPADVERLCALLTSLKLPVELPVFAADAYKGVLMRDKKARDAGLGFVLNKGIGDFSMVCIRDMDEVLAVCGIGG